MVLEQTKNIFQIYKKYIWFFLIPKGIVPVACGRGFNDPLKFNLGSPSFSFF